MHNNKWCELHAFLKIYNVKFSENARDKQFSWDDRFYDFIYLSGILFQTKYAIFQVENVHMQYTLYIQII